MSLLEINSIWSIIVGTVFLAEVPTGVIADRIGRKNSIAIALFLQFLGEFFYIWSREYLAFVLIAILAGIGYAFLSGANEALVYDSLPEQDKETQMKKTMGSLGAAYQLAFFLSPLVGGLVISQLTLSKFILGISLTAASVFIAFLISLTLVEPARDTQLGTGSLAILQSGIHLLLTDRRIQRITAIAVLTSAFSNSLVTFYQPYFVSLGIHSSLLIGVALSFGGLTAFVIQKNIYPIEKFFGKYGFFVISLLPGVLYLVFSGMTETIGLVTVFVFTYAFTDAKNPLISAYQNQLIQSQNRATTISLINMFVQSYVAIMGVVFGIIADRSIPATFIVIGTLIILASLVLRLDRIGELTLATEGIILNKEV